MSGTAEPGRRLEIDRTSGHRTVVGLRDQICLAFLEAYAGASRPLRQRGLYKACRLVGQRLWTDTTARLVLAPDAAVTFPASDPYWNRMLLRTYDHEPEMARLLRSLAGADYRFVDCGANIGYWSVFVASTLGGGKPVLAVEAAGQTYTQLQHNAVTLPNIRTVHRAVLDRSGVTVTLNDAAHEARGVALAGESSAGETVLSATIDELVAETGWLDLPIVVKLDVEGIEREALDGMSRTFASDPLIIYEDHGNDRSHQLTRHILEERGLEVSLLLDDGIAPIRSATELDAYKVDPTRGYNLIATRSGSQWSRLVR